MYLLAHFQAFQGIQGIQAVQAWSVCLLIHTAGTPADT
jgi:hypothetical protein